MRRFINIILIAAVLLGGCTLDDGAQQTAVVTLTACRPAGETTTKGAVSDYNMDNLVFLVYNSADGKCVWSGVADGQSVTCVLPGKSYRAVALANFEDLSGADADADFQWAGLGSLSYTELKSLTFDGLTVLESIDETGVLPMYGEQTFSVPASTEVSIPLARIVDKLTIGTLETAGELAAVGVSFSTTPIGMSFSTVYQVHIDGTPSSRAGRPYEVCTDILNQMPASSRSIYFLAGSTAVFYFNVGGETLAYELTPCPPTGGQRGNIHYVMTKGVFSSSVLCWPEFIFSVDDWNATISIPETI